MALVIETGAIVAGANSYVTVAEIRSYALSRGYEMPSDDAQVEEYAIQAMDYLESFRARYKGTKVAATQPLQWPRKGAFIDGYQFPSDAIPNELKSAQCQACVEILNGYALLPTQDNYAVRKEKVDVLEVEYAAGGGQNSTAVMPARTEFPALEALLDPLLKNGLTLLSATRA